MTTANTPPKPHPVGRGIVRDLQWQVEGSTHMNVCRFQIERKNAQGKRLPSVPVEMRSMSFSGSLANGQWVEVLNEWTSGELLHPKEVYNLTTKVAFKSTLGVANVFKAYPGLAKLNIAIVGIGLVIFVAIAVGIGGIAMNRGHLVDLGNIGRPPAENAAFSLSSSSGAPGAAIRVSGSGWEPSEVVVFRYGPEEIGQVAAEQNGSFANGSITIPRTANGFFKTIDATGTSSDKTVSQPFTVITTAAANSCPASVAPAPNAPSIRVTPTVAARGQTVQVVGSGYTPGVSVYIEVEWGTGSGGAVVVTVDDTGAVVGQLTIPPTAPLGCDDVVARLQTTRREAAYTVLAVTA